MDKYDGFRMRLDGRFKHLHVNGSNHDAVAVCSNELTADVEAGSSKKGLNGNSR
jgi:hypothetical protein